MTQWARPRSTKGSTFFVHGDISFFGGSSGAVPPMHSITLSQKGSLFVTRPTLAHYIATRDDWIGAGDVVRNDRGRRAEDADLAYVSAG